MQLLEDIEYCYNVNNLLLCTETRLKRYDNMSDEEIDYSSNKTFEFIYKNINDFGLDKDYFNDITHIIHAGAFTPKNTFEAK